MLNSLGNHVLPGIVLIIVSSALLLGWEFMRFGWLKDAQLRWPKSTRLRWLENVRLRALVSGSGIVLGVVSMALIVIRFVVIQ
jgi:hypothetical protein